MPCAWIPPAFPSETCVLLGGTRFESPLKSVDFLEAYPAILGQRFEVASLQDCLDSSGKHPSCLLRPDRRRCRVWGDSGRGEPWTLVHPHSSIQHLLC